MSNRLQAVLLMLGYQLFTSAFFGAVFTGYKTADSFMLNIGLGFLAIAQILAGVLVYKVLRSE